MLEWREAGIDVPALSKVPILLPHENFLLENYLKLATSRPPSMGAVAAPIPLSETMAAYVYFDLAEHITRQEWARVVRDLDVALIDHQHEENRSKK
jgi:hypothetical protein